MRIAQVAPLFESIPPQCYGGTERVVSALTEELVRRGHEVTLFASGDSVTAANLKPCVARSLRLDGRNRDHVALTMLQLSEVLRATGEVDVIHSHVDYFGLPFAPFSTAPIVTTTHGRLDLPEITSIYERFPQAPLVSISRAQQQPLPNARWLSVVHNGIDFSAYRLHPEPGTYLAFLGRISPEKRPDRAIEVARALGLPLKIAAKVDERDRDYFEHAIKPFLHDSLVEFVGEITDQEKDEFLGNALAYLFPIDWPEPFGLTMVEAMACGTPVIAMDCGSVREVVSNGVSGIVCDTLTSFLENVPLAATIDRAGCRDYAESRFSASAMADGYERVYAQLIGAPVVAPRTQAALRPQGLPSWATPATLGSWGERRNHRGTAPSSPR